MEAASGLSVRRMHDEDEDGDDDGRIGGPKRPGGMFREVLREAALCKNRCTNKAPGTPDPTTISPPIRLLPALIPPAPLDVHRKHHTRQRRSSALSLEDHSLPEKDIWALQETKSALSTTAHNIRSSSSLFGAASKKLWSSNVAATTHRQPCSNPRHCQLTKYYMSIASSALPRYPLGVQSGQIHVPSDAPMDQPRNDYAPRSYPWPSSGESIGYSQAHAMLAAAYASYGASPNHALPVTVQNDTAALNMVQQQYQRQLRAGADHYGPTPTAVTDEQLASYYQQNAAAGTIAFPQFADANAYQYQPPVSHAPASITENIHAPHPAVASTQAQPTRSTLYFSNLEAWMDAEYFNKVAAMMNWQNVILKIPNAPTNERNGSPGSSGSLVPNNPGYCFITFPTSAAATAVLGSLTEGDRPQIMPNSKNPFLVKWAVVPASSARTLGQRADSFGNDPNASGLFAPGSLTLLNPHTQPLSEEVTAQLNGRQQEFSIFVGDLAPETTNADLIAVFRDPILGLKHDREPKFVAPFLTCKSAKIMVDPVMGVSKGYGFVRFAIPEDASRALIEMQGLYCLSRPMRISHATAKARNHGLPTQSSASVTSHRTPPPQAFTPPFEYDFQANGSDRGTGSTVTSPSAIGPLYPAPSAFMTGIPKESSSPTGSTSSGHSQHTGPTRSIGSTSDPLDALPSDTLNALSSLNINRSTLSQLLRLAMVKPSPDEQGRSPTDSRSALAAVGQFAHGESLGHRASLSVSGPVQAASRSYSQSIHGTSAHSPIAQRNGGQAGNTFDPSQCSQANALLASALGNNASTLNSSDPYNTTVFVGGLSGLISEDTLRTFFGPFGDIHYVKIPPGKGCGFVQFVRKADAEAAISKMQGFPIGGGRVRLSWGRSQYKAAQAAVQAAQLGANVNESTSVRPLTEAHHATQILQALSLNDGGGNGLPGRADFSAANAISPEAQYRIENGAMEQYDRRASSGSHTTMTINNDLSANLSRSHTFPTFAPFGGEMITFSPPSNVSASRSAVGVNARSQLVGIYGAGNPASYGPTPAQRGSIGQRDLETMESVYSTNNYSEGLHGTSLNRGLGPFPVNDLIRQERVGSGSTIVTTSSDKTPPPQPLKNDHEFRDFQRPRTRSSLPVEILYFLWKF
ncbi:RRM protein [Tulasnella sp. 427]|nr:RRM protein [Tulasnella sp. 427]